MSGILQSLQCMWAGRSVGKVILFVGLVVCVYQAWKRWYIRRLVTRKFRGKVVLITGASSGLGEALGRVFHIAGSKVILASRNLQKLEQLKFQFDNKPGNGKEIVRYSPKILGLDLTDASSLASKCQEAVAMYGRVDILINNAGVSSRGSVMDTDTEVDRRIMELNFFGTISFTKGVLPSMLEQGCGQIIVISSLQGRVGLPNRSSYSASKHALQGYFDSLRCELSPRGISVSVISPGYISTGLSLNALQGDGTKHGMMDPSTASGMSPHKAARAILEAVAEGKRELILAKPAHQVAVYLRVFCPGLLDKILEWREKR